MFKNLDIEHTGFTEEQINVLLDVEPWLEGKMHAWYLHHSQVDPVLPINRLPRHIQRKWHNREYYQLATTRVDEDILAKMISSHVCLNPPMRSERPRAVPMPCAALPSERRKVRSLRIFWDYRLPSFARTAPFSSATSSILSTMATTK